MRLRRHSEMRESERTEKGAKASGVLTLQSQWLSGSIASSMFFLTRVHALTTGRQSGMFPQHECDCNGRQTCTARTLLCQSTETILENKRASFFPSSHHLLSVTPWDTMAFKVRKKAPSCCKVKWDSSGMQFITLLIACWCLFVYLLKYHWGKCFPFPLHISRELVKSSADYITFCSIYCKYCSHFPPRFWVWWDFHPSQKTTF